jgi:predicted permease
MAPILYQLFNVLAPVLVVAAMGFGWAKARQPFDNMFVSSLTFNVATPMLIFSSLTKLHVDPAAVAEVALATFAVTVTLIVVGAGLLWILRIPLRPYLTPVMVPNTGNVGLPVCYLAFGDQGLALAVVVHVVSAAMQFTVGIAITSGTFSLKDLAKVPLIYAVAAAMIVVESGIELPAWIANAAALIGQLAIPLMLMGLGVSLNRLRTGDLGRSMTVTVVRLGLGFAAAWAAAVWVFGLGHVQTGVLVLQMSMPAAVFTYMMAARYNCEPEGVAGVVLVSTLIGFATMPLILLLVL